MTSRVVRLDSGVAIKRSRSNDDGIRIDTAGVRRPGKRGYRMRAAAVVIVCAIPAAAAAQSAPPTPIDDVRQHARIHVGPLYATPALQLREVGIDSNVFNVYGDNQQSDF